MLHSETTSRRYHADESPALRGSKAKRVGFYGCNMSGDGAVVRLTRDPEDGYPRTLRIKCPACKHEHDVRPFWRRWISELDDDKEALLV